MKKPLISLGFWALLWEFRVPYAKGIATLFLVDAANVAIPLALKSAVDAIAASDRNQVGKYAVVILALFFFQAVGRYWWRIYLMGSSHRIAGIFRKKFFDHVLNVPAASYRQVSSGDLMARATQDIEAVRMALGPGVLVIADCVILFFLILPAMWGLSPKLTLISLAVLPLVPLITYLCGSRIDVLFDKMQSQTSGMTQFIRERFTHVRLLKAFSAERFAGEELRHLSFEYSRTGKKLALVESFFSPGLVLFTNVGTLLILFFGGQLALQGALTLGAFVAFQRLIVQLAWPMEAIGWAVTLTREAKASLRRVNQILELPRAEDTGVYPLEKASAPLLEIRQFSQPLFIQPGKWVGLVGPIASGKSTLLDNILRIAEPAPGSIFVHGVDITGFPRTELRRRFRIVDQPVTLLGEDLLANVSLSLPIPMERAVLNDLSELASFDATLRFGDEMEGNLISEKGADLSGGQKQRIALIRALSTSPELLLLDDPFSGIDLSTEEKIFRGLRRRYPKMSVLFVSHRFDLMKSMDEIWVMEAGRVVEKGSHSDLLAQSPRYQMLAQSEFPRAIEGAV